KVLQLVSSSFFGQPRRVDPDEAVRLLGLDLIRALRSRDALAVAADDRGESQATTVAAAARALCVHLGGNERAVADAGLAGLLHGCGSLVEGSLPVDEPVMAASLLGMWGLSDGVINAVLHQRSPSAAKPAEQVAAGALHAALVLQGQLTWDGTWLASQGDAAGLVARLTEASKLATVPQVMSP
ncbi:MAG: HDOD domain-containing protein, partial [Chloroflexi bacterium]|nr:HDOD domain-containing protein [Chloroflexota bacterium]